MMEQEIHAQAEAAKAASYRLAVLRTDERNAALSAMADALISHTDEILHENAADVEEASHAGTRASYLDRLRLDEERVAGMAEGLRLTAALLWVVIFFAATLQGERLFAEEAAAGTLLFLRIYVPAQAVLFGKMAAHFVTLLVLTVIVLPLILILMDAPFVLDAMLGAVLFLGLWGMAAADTLLAAVAANASVRGGLIPVLLLPSMLPILLPAIALTAGEGEPALLGGMLIYDMALTVGASMLFDSLWIES